MNKLKTGIWLDFRDAYIITLGDDAQAMVHHLHSEIHHQATKGGSRSKSPWGPQFSPPDDNNLERDKHAEHHFYRQIIGNINPETEEIVIFGPAEAKIGLKKEIESIKHYKPQLTAVLTWEYLTQNEMIALMRDFFVNREKYVVPDKA